MTRRASRPLSRRAQSAKSAEARVGRPINRAAVVDAELRRLATRVETDFLEICELVEEVRREGFHARFGFVDVERYLEDRIGLSYRSVARRLAAAKAVRALPAPDQDDAKNQLAALGASKAAVLAPALQQDPAGWRDWVKKAATESVEGLQRKVTTALGLKARGQSTDAPGARWLAYTLNQVPPETREEVEAVFKLGATVAESDNAVQVFLCMVREVKVEWDHRGVTA